MMKLSRSFSATRSSGSSLPSLRSTSARSIVASRGLNTDGLSRPAVRQCRTGASPIDLVGRDWLVIARTIRSGRAVLYAVELTTTAGRFLVVRWFVNGNGTRTMSPSSKLVVGAIGGVGPDFGERALREFGGGPCQPTVRLALAEELDEILDLGNPVGRKFLDLCHEVLHGSSTLSHPNPSTLISKYRAVTDMSRESPNVVKGSEKDDHQATKPRRKMKEAAE